MAAGFQEGMADRYEPVTQTILAVLLWTRQQYVQGQLQ